MLAGASARTYRELDWAPQKKVSLTLYHLEDWAAYTVCPRTIFSIRPQVKYRTNAPQVPRPIPAIGATKSIKQYLHFLIDQPIIGKKPLTPPSR